MKKLTAKEIITETAEYYKESPKDRRSVVYNEVPKLESVSCQYLSSDNRKCAFGRVLNDWAIKIISKNPILNRTDIHDLFEEEERFESIDHIVKPEYQGHNIVFWDDIQGFHDLEENWTETGLTLVGKIHLEKLYEDWS